MLLFDYKIPVEADRALRDAYVALAFAFRRLEGSARSRDTELCSTLLKVRAEIERVLKAQDAAPAEALAAPSASQEALREALDLDKAVSTAALTWCGEKDRETFQSDVDYFKHNWRALPGLTAYVDRELGKRARAALAQSAPVKGGE